MKTIPCFLFSPV